MAGGGSASSMEHEAILRQLRRIATNQNEIIEVLQDLKCYIPHHLRVKDIPPKKG